MAKKPTKKVLTKVGSGITVLVGCNPEDVANWTGKGVLHEVLTEDPERSCVWCLEDGEQHIGKGADRVCPDNPANSYLPRDPNLMAHDLQKSIQDDWPGFRWSRIDNDRAAYLAWQRRMHQIGMTGTVEEYLAL